MIAYIKGTFAELTPTFVVIETAGGVAYHLNISLYTYERIKTAKAGVLHAHPVVKEDSHTLYGFAEPDERELFRQLISVSGIGPASAQMMLSSLSPNDLRQAIAAGEVSVLKTVKGIGAKTAQRVILDLKDTMQKYLTLQAENAPTPASGAVSGVAVGEAVSALQMLGFTKAVAEKAVSRVTKAADTDLTTETLIKEALKVV